MPNLTERNLPELRKDLSSLEGGETFGTAVTLVLTTGGGLDMARYYGAEAHGVSQACPRPNYSAEITSYNNLYNLKDQALAAAQNGTFEEFRSNILLSPTLEQSASILRQDQQSYDCYLAHGLWRDMEPQADAVAIALGLICFLVTRSLTKQVQEKRDTLHRLVEKIKVQGKAAKLYL